MNPVRLTGAEVRRIRESQRPRISRKQFAELIGRTPTRVYNIEEKDSWKPGDLEAVAAVLAQWGELPDAGGAVPDGDGGYRPEGETPLASVDLLGVDEEELVRFVDVLREHNATLVMDVTPLEDEDEERFIDVLTPPVLDVPDDGLDVRLDARVHVSNSQVQTFDRCRRKWWLSWFRGLHLRASSPTGHRALGDRVHRALATYYVADDARRLDPREALELAIVDDWTRYVGSLDGAEPDEQIARDFLSEATLQRAMIEGYVGWLAETGEDEHLRVIGSEQVRAADVVIETTGRTRTLVGRLDVRVRRETDGVRLFMDHKTVPDLTGPVRTLHMDPQMLFYHIIEWLSGDGESRCDGALYNMLRKSKRTQQARPPFFGRFEVRHNERELESELLQVLAKLEDIDAARDMLNAGVDHRIAVPRSARSDCSWSCDFFPVCPLFDDGSYAEEMLAQWYEEGDPMAYYEPRLST
jgi:PD-(D/E)XK nuclease superfamily